MHGFKLKTLAVAVTVAATTPAVADYDKSDSRRDRNFDLRQPSAYRELPYKLAQVVDHRVDGMRQNVAAMHVRNERRMPFAKPDQRAAFARNVLYRQAGTATVIPFRTGHRR